MRRIILAACAVVLLHAAPSMAAECTNLASPRAGGTATASSEYGGWYATALNSGSRENPRTGTYYWRDGDRDVFPDWGQIEWRSAQTIDRIVVRVPTFNSFGYEPVAERKLSRVRVQYWDAASSAWVDASSSVSGQVNPVVDWIAPWITADGEDDMRQFDISPISTTKIRVLVEGTPTGWSFLDEIEAYEDGHGCDEPPIRECSANIALDGTASASSTHSSGLYPVSGVNNGRRESGDSKGYWNDNTNGTWPDWVQVAWDRPQTIDRIVARIPLAREEFPLGEITLRRTRIQYWDAATSTWVDVTGARGQDNPITDWSGPREVYDGSESRTFDLPTPVTTTKIRALIEDGSSDGWSWLDELEAYSSNCGTTPRDVNFAPDGTALGSSEWATYWADAWRVNDGRRQASSSDGFWRDSSYGIGHDWVQVSWAAPKTINRLIVRGAYWYVGSTIGERTFGETHVQYWDPVVPRWRDVPSRQPNPLINWVLPEGRLDGSEIKQFDFPAISTRRVRVLFEVGSSFGYDYLDELEAWWI